MKLHDSKDGVLPTFLPFESSSQDEDMSEEKESHVVMKQAGAEELEGSEGGDKNTPLLLSEEALTQLLQVSEEAEKTVEEDEDDNDGPEKDKEVKEMEGKENGESTMENEDETKKSEGEDTKETDSSTDSEIPMDLDYAADRDASQPLSIKLEEAKASTINTMEKDMAETIKDVIPTATMDYDSQQSSNDSDDIAEEQEVPEEQTQDELKELFQDSDNEKKKSDQQDEKNSIEPEILSSGKKANKKQKNESNRHGKAKAKKQRNNQRLEKMQSDQAGAVEANEEHAQMNDPEKVVEPTENTESKPRKKNGKWVQNTSHIHCYYKI